MHIRPYRAPDEAHVVQLWLDCGLVVPHNHPVRDIQRKLRVNPEWFLVGEREDRIVASCMVGYEGHRGWINYLAVSPDLQGMGFGRAMVARAEALLRDAGCPKINLQVRSTNQRVIAFYQRLGYTVDDAVSLGKRLEPDPPYEAQENTVTGDAGPSECAPSVVSPPTRQDRVCAYYGAFDEWSRLDTAEGAFEFGRTLDLLKSHLAPDSRVLDLGGGPGRYAAELVRWGHRVVLADIAPTLLNEARKRFEACGVTAGIESIDEINATDLGRYEDASFDTVLALGPFYHLVSETERSNAAREIHRVLRPSGLAFVAFIPRQSGIAGLIQRAAANPAQVTPEVFRAAADTGVFRNATDTGFQEGYYAAPNESEGLLRDTGFEIADVVSLRSIAHGLGEELARLDGPLREVVERVAAGCCRQPEVIAAGGHALTVARKAVCPR